MRLFDREMVVGGVGTSNKNKPVVDYLMTFTDYAGTEILKARTKNAKSILVIGSNNEFSDSTNPVESNLKKDTFELFRRGTNNVDIITFDELLERAKFITKS